jgi:hypothetical protein
MLNAPCELAKDLNAPCELAKDLSDLDWIVKR